MLLHFLFLLFELSFYFAQDMDSLRGMYEHPILQAVINAQFFAARSKSVEIIFSAAFNPAPYETIALVFTVVWSSFIYLFIFLVLFIVLISSFRYQPMVL